MKPKTKARVFAVIKLSGSAVFVCYALWLSVNWATLECKQDPMCVSEMSPERREEWERWKVADLKHSKEFWDDAMKGQPKDQATVAIEGIAQEMKASRETCAQCCAKEEAENHKKMRNTIQRKGI
jgi:hypothetical protein